MEELFKVGNKLTTNNRNILEVITTNDYQVVFKDLLNGDFCVLDKTEHKYALANAKIILEISLKEILDETDATEKDKKHILTQVGCRIAAWI